MPGQGGRGTGSWLSVPGRRGRRSRTQLSAVGGGGAPAEDIAVGTLVISRRTIDVGHSSTVVLGHALAAIIA